MTGKPQPQPEPEPKQQQRKAESVGEPKAGPDEPAAASAESCHTARRDSKTEDECSHPHPDASTLSDFPECERPPEPDPRELSEPNPDSQQPITDEQILSEMCARTSIGEAARERRERGLTFTELGAERQLLFSRERDEKLRDFGGDEISRIFARIEASQLAQRVASQDLQQPPRLIRVGIALMTREPHCFDWWLRYHRSLGIEHVYVHVEGSPALLSLLQSDEFATFVTVVAANQGNQEGGRLRESNYFGLMERQERHVVRSTQLAKERGLDWLFHIDDDELLHFAVPMRTLVASAPLGTTCLALINAEAIPNAEVGACVFEEIDTFTLHRMVAYRNGKAAGAVQAGARFSGPHRFTGPCYVPPVTEACVLHFESCTYEAWRDKFLRHVQHCDASRKNDIPFVFYRDSITCLQDCPRERREEDEYQWRAFYRERKIAHYSSLGDEQRLVLSLQPHPNAMINEPP